MNLFGWFSGLEYPHWMMIGGGALVVLGFLGFALRQNKIDPPRVAGEE
jgi:hypothetical protein